MAPATHGHNIVVKVLEKSTIVDKTLANGTHVREELVLVADNTGCMYLHARDGKVFFYHDLTIFLSPTRALRGVRLLLTGCHFCDAIMSRPMRQIG